VSDTSLLPAMARQRSPLASFQGTKASGRTLQSAEKFQFVRNLVES